MLGGITPPAASPVLKHRAERAKDVNALQKPIFAAKEQELNNFPISSNQNLAYQRGKK